MGLEPRGPHPPRGPGPHHDFQRTRPRAKLESDVESGCRRARGFRATGVFGEIHPGRLTWNLRIHPWKRKIIFQTIIFRFYVNLRGCRWWNFATWKLVKFVEFVGSFESWVDFLWILWSKNWGQPKRTPTYINFSQKWNMWRQIWEVSSWEVSSLKTPLLPKYRHRGWQDGHRIMKFRVPIFHQRRIKLIKQRWNAVAELEWFAGVVRCSSGPSH